MKLALAVALSLIALPALAQTRPDPAEQAVVGSVQVLINSYEQNQAALAAADKELACWKATGKACAVAKPPKAKPVTKQPGTPSPPP